MQLTKITVRYNKFIAVPQSNGTSGYVPTLDTYLTYIKDNGEKVYVFKNELITKEEGNDYYLETKRVNKDNNYFESKEVVAMSDDDFISDMEARVDRYTEYIDDFKQQKVVENRNKNIYSIINAVKGGK